MKSTYLRTLFSLALICLCCAVVRAEDDEDTNALDELPGKVKPKDADDLDRELIKSLEGDKGTTDAKGDDALDRAIRGMRNAGRRIEEEELDGETHDIQEKVVAELDELIKQLKRRPPPSQQNKPQNEDQQDQQDQQNQKQSKKQQQPQNSAQQKQKSQQKKGGSKQEQQKSKAEQSKEEKAQESTDKIRNDKTKTAEEQRREKLDRDVWGHLPPSLREKLLNVSSEKFLPKYEEMVRSYYEALAERNRQAQ